MMPIQNAPRAAQYRVSKSIGLLLLGVVLLTLAFAPSYQFYLASIGLAPWLMVVQQSRTARSAFVWSWLTGTAFFTANMWWVAGVNAPGMIALMIYCGFYWGLAAAVIRGGRLLEGKPIVAVAGIAALWTAGEFVRSFLFTGIPWLFIGHTQSPFLAMCQIADIGGVYAVTFWVVMINVLVAILMIRGKSRDLIPAAITVGGVLAVSLGYGLWRMNQSTQSLGPTVMVVQSNYPQSNSGEKGASQEELTRFHIETTRKALDQAGSGVVNLAAWSETMMPPINRETINEEWNLQHTPFGHDTADAIAQISDLAKSEQTSLLIGGHFWDKFDWTQFGGEKVRFPTEERNTAYLFNPDGSFGDRPGERYDKIHLVPFGEYIPLRHTFLYRIFLALGPRYYANYQLTDGTDNGLTVFSLRDAVGTPRWKFVSPICFEDSDANLCAAMMRPGSDGLKRADFFVNITNDGWFADAQHAQHLQSAVFRAIENRVPMARSVNTGTSGFIDSVGRVSHTIASSTEGTSLMQLQLDGRITFYTRFGDLFAWICVIASAGLIGRTIIRATMMRKRVAIQ